MLGNMHPLLPVTTTAEYTLRAALALERSHHQPMVRLNVSGGGPQADLAAVLDWDCANDRSATIEQLDRHRVTEDGAEAVALALVSVSHGWSIRRRLQRGEAADWLLIDSNAALIALEISGIDGAPDARRLSAKLEQVRNAKGVTERFACVASFGPPAVSLGHCDGDQ